MQKYLIPTLKENTILMIPLKNTKRALAIILLQLAKSITYFENMLNHTKNDIYFSFNICTLTINALFEGYLYFKSTITCESGWPQLKANRVTT